MIILFHKPRLVTANRCLLVESTFGTSFSTRISIAMFSSSVRDEIKKKFVPKKNIRGWKSESF